MIEAPRVVLVKLAALGDVIMASTLVGALRTRWPESQLTWVTGTPLAPLVGRLDGVDSILPVDTAALLTGRLPARVAALAAAWRAIGRQPYDLGLVAHTDPRYASLLWGARVRAVRRFRVGPLGSPHGADAAGQDASPREWMGAAYARMLDGLNGDHPRPSPPRLARLQLSPEELARGKPAHGAVLVAPGGARNLLRDNPLRRWPLSQWVALTRALVAAGHRVVLVGSPEDTDEAAALTAAVPAVTSLVGRTTLLELAALLARARLLVSHDSGPMHLAALTRTPTVALFGPTDPAVFVPPGAAVVVASAAANLPCAPCYDGKGYAACRSNRCLNEVTSVQVMRAVDVLLADRPVQKDDTQ